ncbi:hypothetical protein [Aquibium sp. ELW1220]|uniref:hypothetical protein n=1 Tax=Aquibium sp. ELW1220 TaxID=2976766 RepID=UPI0025AEE81D|nr:hypothetical protein [Aquibium sp. ELW1220]MDN2584090.1 hypothetical protein [Aquibium sp. ELW1220]
MDAALDAGPGRTYGLATNGWTAMNHQSRLGTDVLGFSDVPDLGLKQAVRPALADG